MKRVVAEGMRSGMFSLGCHFQGFIAAKISCFLDFHLEEEAQLVVDLSSDGFYQVEECPAGGVAIVDEEVGVLGADVGATYGKAFKAQVIQELPHGDIWKIFEETTGVRHVYGLCGFSLLQELVAFLSGLFRVCAM